MWSKAPSLDGLRCTQSVAAGTLRPLFVGSPKGACEPKSLSMHLFWKGEGVFLGQPNFSYCPQTVLALLQQMGNEVIMLRLWEICRKYETHSFGNRSRVHSSLFPLGEAINFDEVSTTNSPKKSTFFVVFLLTLGLSGFHVTCCLNTSSLGLVSWLPSGVQGQSDVLRKVVLLTAPFRNCTCFVLRCQYVGSIWGRTSVVINMNESDTSVFISVSSN